MSNAQSSQQLSARTAVILERFWGLRPGQILGISLLIVVGGFVVYLLYFGLLLGQSLSDKSSDWADFGSYFQGVAGALLAFLGMWLVAHSLRASIRDIDATLKLGQAQLEATQVQIDDQRVATLLGLLERLERTLSPIQLALDTALANEKMTPYGFLASAYPGRTDISMHELVNVVNAKHQRAGMRQSDPSATVFRQQEAVELEQTLMSVNPAVLKRLVRLCLRYSQRTELYDLVERKLKMQLAAWLGADHEYLGLRDPDELRSAVPTLGVLLGTLPSRPNGIFIGATPGLRRRFGEITII